MELKIIKELIEFTWKRNDEDKDWMFGLKDIMSHYDCYNYRILESENHQLLILKIVPSLQVFSNYNLLFTGELVLHYNIIDIDNSYGFDTILMHVLKMAHDEFIKTFRERESSTLLREFEPIFEEQVVNEHISLLLRIFER